MVLGSRRTRNEWLRVRGHFLWSSFIYFWRPPFQDAFSNSFIYELIYAPRTGWPCHSLRGLNNNRPRLFHPAISHPGDPPRVHRAGKTSPAPR